MNTMGGVNSFRRNSMKCGEAYYHISLSSSKKSYTSIFNYLTHITKKINEDQPLYVFDLADILWKAQLWNERFPSVAPYYAVKANADPVLIKLFVLLGYGFDCSTEGEIRLVKNAGADPQKIIFAHTTKTRKALKYASSIGVDLMTFDSKEELLKIKEEFPTARLILRLKSASAQTVYNLSKKFGCALSEAEDLLLRAKDLNLNVVGVSFHVGALCDDPKTYTSTIENSRQVFDMAERLGYKFTIMDIGAGFFGSPEREEYFHKLSEEINMSLEDNFPNGDVKFIAEPGCYCVASAVYFITRIIGKKSVALNDQSDERREYYLNDGYYGSFFEHKEIYDVKPVPVLTTSELEKRPRYKTKFWGQTCCSEDIILEECLLPDLEEGEFVVWVNLGAYARGVASNFTVVPFPANKYVFVQNSKLILDSIPNQQEIAEYISKEADLIQDSQEMNVKSMNPSNLKDLLKTQ